MKWTVCAVVALVLLCSPARAEEGVTLLPAEFTLATSRSSQRLLVQRSAGGELATQLVKDLEWSSNRPEIASVADGVVRPVADGDAVITVRSGRQVARAKVRVTGSAAPTAWSFRNHVEPVLARLGCNSGACHGALAGKGGFRLSLRGYDPAADAFQIVKADRGRRVEFSDPGRSLILSKPSGAIPHKGGVRFEPESSAYRVLAEWIAAGALPPSEADARVVALEVLPAGSLHHVGETQQILVRASYSDGRTEDVTPWAKWSSADEAVCRVDDSGLAAVVGPGEGALVAWFASKIAIARISVPYPLADSRGADATYVDRRPPRNFIDEQINRELKRLNLPFSPDCTDAEFLRRATVDAIGRLPTLEETRAFLGDASANKRDALIDRLLTRPEFVDYWTYKWCDILTLTSTRLMPEALRTYYQWVRRQVAANTPWDQFVRQILLATGDSLENGATNFYALSQSPEDMTENACQAFLGLSIGCAKCHDHPLEKWTNDQYYAMSNLFARVRAKGWGGEGGGGDGRRTLYVAHSGDLIQPRTGKPQSPTPLDGQPLLMDDPADRRKALAEWLTAPANPYFARAITNRIWANYFGVGLVEKVDDVRASNPASNEALLRAASDALIGWKFDVKALMKAILQSNAYQRSSRLLPANRGEQRFYSRYYPRRMMAEVLHDAVVQVTQVPTTFEWLAGQGGDRRKTDFYPPGTRAIQLYDAAVESYFLQSFGRNPRRIVCECDRSQEPTVVQVLHLTNGATLNDKLKAAGNRIDALIRLRKQGMADAALVDELYLVCLARYPTTAERAALMGMLTPPGAPDERPLLEDVLWGLLSSREFLFNH